MSRRIALGGSDFPFKDAAGEAGLELDLEAEPGGLDGFESDAVVGVFFEAVVGGVLDRDPALAILV